MLPAKTRAGALSGLVLIGLVAWFAHFSLSSQFLFYEDDYAKVVDAMARNFEESAYNFYCHCRDWPQGRPLGFGLIAPFSYVGVKMGGLQGVYITGYLMLLANTGLFFLLTRKFAGTNAAIFGALVFCLFPADTVKNWATHFMGNEPAIFFMLMAFLLYLSRFRWLSYLLIFIAAMTYESTLLPFLAAPLMDTRAKDGLGKRLARHWALLAALLILYCLIRMNLGEPRMTRQLASMGLWQITYKAITAMIIGPLVVLKSFFVCPALPSSLGGIFSLIVVLISGLGFLGFFLKIDSRRTGFPWKTMGTALLLLVLSYPMAFFPPHWPPVALATTASRVHFAATVGGSMAIGILLGYFYNLAAANKKPAVFISLAALYFGLLAGYHYSVQQDYTQSAARQKTFWTGVLALCPDMGENTLILAEQPLWDHPGLMSTHSWATRLVLEKLIQFPKHWENAPQLYCMDQWVKDHVFQEPECIVWREIIYDQVYRPHILHQNNVIVLSQGESGKMERLYGTYRLGSGQSVSLDLKPRAKPALESFSAGIAYQYVIGGGYPPDIKE